MCGVGALHWTNGSLGFCPPAPPPPPPSHSDSYRVPRGGGSIGLLLDTRDSAITSRVLLKNSLFRCRVRRFEPLCSSQGTAAFAPRLVSLSLSRMIFIKFLLDGTTRLCPCYSYELWYLLRQVTQVLLSTPSASAAAFLRIDFISSLYFSFITSWK